MSKSVGMNVIKIKNVPGLTSVILMPGIESGHVDIVKTYHYHPFLAEIFSLLKYFCMVYVTGAGPPAGLLPTLPPITDSQTSFSALKSP